MKLLLAILAASLAALAAAVWAGARELTDWFYWLAGERE